MIELSGVSKTFNPGRPNEFTALKAVTLAIEPRRMTVLKGPSGSGKTTLLSIIGCMAKPTAGRARLDGRELTSLPERYLAEIRRKTFGFIFQSFNLIRGVTVLENVMLPAYPTGESVYGMRRRALDILARLGLEPKAGQRVEQLSGGERQRTAIARALMNDPAVIIADEPTANLDSELARRFMELMIDLKREGRTIVIASHDPIVHENQAADRVVSMRDGAIIGSDTLCGISAPGRPGGKA
jgi:putative ABC transport system ATP-binding protein